LAGEFQSLAFVECMDDLAED
jgi:hypothetical protein